ncbi:MAG TPA: SRPBCC domain-containing protein [Lacunisphaera sp.]|jgi:uncharacterized protein YndB with AHSA1/START domain
MNPMFANIGIIVGIIVLPATLLYVFGSFQPERHTSTIAFMLPQPPAVVWPALTDYTAMPQWWPAVKKVHFETRTDGQIITWNTGKHGKEIGFRTIEEKAPTRLVREIVGNDLPFGGTWTYSLAAEQATTRLTLTEDGFIKSPFLRAIAKLFLKPDTTMRDFEKNFTVYMEKK